MTYEFNVHVTECACVEIEADSYEDACAEITRRWREKDGVAWEFEWESVEIHGEGGYVYDERW